MQYMDPALATARHLAAMGVQTILNYSPVSTGKLDGSRVLFEGRRRHDCHLAPLKLGPDLMSDLVCCAHPDC